VSVESGGRNFKPFISEELDRALLVSLLTWGHGQPMTRLRRSILVQARLTSLFHRKFSFSDKITVGDGFE
jgi:hypothetical protein